MVCTVVSTHTELLIYGYNLPRSLSEIRAAIPPHLFIRDTRRAMGYFARDATMAAAALVLAAHTQQILASPFVVDHLGHSTAKLLQAFAWLV